MNTITITGRIDGDTIRKEANDSVVTTFRLASGRTGNRGGRLWIDVDAWGALGGTAARSYQTADGAKATHWFIVASDIEYLDKPGRRGTSAAAT